MRKHTIERRETQAQQMAREMAEKVGKPIKLNRETNVSCDILQI